MCLPLTGNLRITSPTKPNQAFLFSAVSLCRSSPAWCPNRSHRNRHSVAVRASTEIVLVGCLLTRITDRPNAQLFLVVVTRPLLCWLVKEFILVPISPSPLRLLLKLWLVIVPCVSLPASVLVCLQPNQRLGQKQEQELLELNVYGMHACSFRVCCFQSKHYIPPINMNERQMH